MKCEICSCSLNKSNTIGVCREHRTKANKIREYQKAYRAANPTISNKAKKLWAKNNPKYHSERLKKDPNAKLAHTIRVRINRAIKNKAWSATKSLGCTIQELKLFIENKFQKGMSWENYGQWQLDHIYPLSKFDLTIKSEFEKACHYTNLQPLWKTDNIRKGNRIQSSQECLTSLVDGNVR